MKTVRTLSRILAPATLVLLAACQTVPGNKTTPAPSTPAPAPAPETSMPAATEGASVGVFLADTTAQTGWTSVTIPSGSLYVNPQPVVTRADLSGVQAGTNKQGDGLLALQLNDAGKQRVADITTKNPNKRLALVVGRTMMAAPGYTSPVTTGQLVFVVGTEANATAAARAIAGVQEGAAPAAGNSGAGAPANSAVPGASSAPRTPTQQGAGR